MKNLFLLISFIFICSPVFAWNEKAAEVSLDYLNNSVYPKVHSFNQILYADEAKINKYKKSYNYIGKYLFASSCKQRSENLLKTYENDYFKPAYKKYLEYDKSLSFYDWIHSIALSEISLFYDFYAFTEENLRSCNKLLTNQP